MKRAQTSIEASLVITFMIFVLVSFMGVLAKRTLETQKDKEMESLEAVAQIIKREIMLADRVQEGYTRNVSLPIRAWELTYNVTLINSTVLGKNYSELVITANISGDSLSAVELLPANVGGRICAGTNKSITVEKTANKIRVKCN
jgi:hypothetical protein